MCNKCGGLTVTERTPQSRGEEVDRFDPLQSRCINCGSIDSALIRRNRSRPQREGSILLEDVPEALVCLP